MARASVASAPKVLPAAISEQRGNAIYFGPTEEERGQRKPAFCSRLDINVCIALGLAFDARRILGVSKSHKVQLRIPGDADQRSELMPISFTAVVRNRDRHEIGTKCFADGFISETVSDLWEPWMRQADQALEDEALLLILQQELAKRCKKSKTRGRPGTTAEVILRMLLLKHFRDWSFEDLTREVRANLVYREFTRIGGGRVPDDKTMGRLARQLGPEVVEQIHRRIVEIALEKKVASGRKLRVDTTVVETNIHYSDRQQSAGRRSASIDPGHEESDCDGRDRMRSIKLKVLAIARASRNKTESGKKKLQKAYVGLLEATSRVVGQAKKFSYEIAERIKRGNRKLLSKARRQLDEMIPRVQQVMRQARQRVLGGNTRAEGKLVSVFEPETEVIRKGKAEKPNEFGKLVKIQEVENQLITITKSCRSGPVKCFV